MISAFSEVYEGYKGDKEPHRARLLVTALVSIVIAVFASDLPRAALPAIASSVSVLAGFTFTGLFSGYLLGRDSLAPPADETDRRELERLKQLNKSFKVRAKYFLIIAVTELLIVILLSVNVYSDISTCLSSLGVRGGIQTSLWWAFKISSRIVVFLAFLALLEILYTFYRISETVLAIIHIQQSYKEAGSQ